MKTPRLLTFLFLLTAGITHAQAQGNAAPASAQTEMQKWIATTDAQWQATFNRDVVDVHAAELKKLAAQYGVSLEAALTKATAAGELDGAVALRNEQKRFSETNFVPEQDAATDAATVKQIRTVPRVQLAKIEQENAARTRALYAKYDTTLAQAQQQLTQAKRLDDALLVKAKRDEIAAAWLAGISAAPPPTVAVERPKPFAPSGSAKLLKDQLQILPFVKEFETHKFAPQDPAVPDELGVTVSGRQIHIAGIKKGAARDIMGRATGHHGKLALISATASQSGTLVAKIPSAHDRVSYGIVVELANDTLKYKPLIFEANVACDWSVKINGSKFVFSVVKQGKVSADRRVGSIEEPANEVKGFGFFSTVRNPTNEADLIVTVDAMRR